MGGTNNSQNTRHYAIYGGSFDPVHSGHVALAKSAVKECAVDRLIFMPAYMSPFKQDRQTAPGADRAAMIESILHYDPAFCMSRYELNKEGPSYTYDTIMHWKPLLGGKLSFVMGMDSAIQVDTWFRGRDILKEVSLIVSIRPGSDVDTFNAKAREYKEKYGTEVHVLSMDPVDISSTDVRTRIEQGMPISGIVPPEVEKYIFEHDLYTVKRT